MCVLLLLLGWVGGVCNGGECSVAVLIGAVSGLGAGSVTLTISVFCLSVTVSGVPEVYSSGSLYILSGALVALRSVSDDSVSDCVGNCALTATLAVLTASHAPGDSDSDPSSVSVSVGGASGAVGCSDEASVVGASCPKAAPADLFGPKHSCILFILLGSSALGV